MPGTPSLTHRKAGADTRALHVPGGQSWPRRQGRGQRSRPRLLLRPGRMNRGSSRETALSEFRVGRSHNPRTSPNGQPSPGPEAGRVPPAWAPAKPGRWAPFPRLPGEHEEGTGRRAKRSPVSARQMLLLPLSYLFISRQTCVRSIGTSLSAERRPRLTLSCHSAGRKVKAQGGAPSRKGGIGALEARVPGQAERRSAVSPPPGHVNGVDGDASPRGTVREAGAGHSRRERQILASVSGRPRPGGRIPRRTRNPRGCPRAG